MIDRVFVYGTLKREGSYHHLVATFVREVREGSVPGDLVDLGDYPGWVEGEGRVYGEVFRVDPVDEALHFLDAFEDYHGEGDPRNLYDRLVVDVSTRSGPVRAWAYKYRGPAAGSPRIRGGVWRARRDG